METSEQSPSLKGNKQSSVEGERQHLEIQNGDNKLNESAHSRISKIGKPAGEGSEIIDESRDSIHRNRENEYSLLDAGKDNHPLVHSRISQANQPLGQESDGPEDDISNASKPMQFSNQNEMPIL